MFVCTQRVRVSRASRPVARSVLSASKTFVQHLAAPQLAAPSGAGSHGRSVRPSTWQQRRVSNGPSTQGMLSTRLKQPGPAQSSYGKRKQANRPWRAPSYPTMVMVHVTTPRLGWNQSFKRFKAACNQPTSPKPQPPSPTIPTCKPSPTNL